MLKILTVSIPILIQMKFICSITFSLITIVHVQYTYSGTYQRSVVFNFANNRTTFLFIPAIE